MAGTAWATRGKWARALSRGRTIRPRLWQIVGFGSFYNHFDSKEAIVEAVLADTIAAQGAAIDAITAGLDDPAEIISAAHRYFVRLARTDPDWLTPTDAAEVACRPLPAASTSVS